MNFAIDLLEKYKNTIDKSIKSTGLMHKDMTIASRELSKITQLKEAIKILKNKKRRH